MDNRIREQLARNLVKEQEAANAAKILERCEVDPMNGYLIRGRVSVVKCWVCGRDRYDDGTPCKHPGKMPNTKCGARVKVGYDRMEDGRIG